MPHTPYIQQTLERFLNRGKSEESILLVRAWYIEQNLTQNAQLGLGSRLRSENGEPDIVMSHLPIIKHKAANTCMSDS